MTTQFIATGEKQTIGLENLEIFQKSSYLKVKKWCQLS